MKNLEKDLKKIAKAILKANGCDYASENVFSGSSYKGLSPIKIDTDNLDTLPEEFEEYDVIATVEIQSISYIFILKQQDGNTAWFIQDIAQY